MGEICYEKTGKMLPHKRHFPWASLSMKGHNPMILQINLCPSKNFSRQQDSKFGLIKFLKQPQGFGINSNSDLKTSHQLWWYCILRLKFNSAGVKDLLLQAGFVPKLCHLKVLGHFSEYLFEPVLVWLDIPRALVVDPLYFQVKRKTKKWFTDLKGIWKQKRGFKIAWVNVSLVQSGHKSANRD